MVENWIGADAFRDAIRAYLKKYSWSNAAAEDLWASLEGSSRVPIHTVLESFVDVTGAPLLHVEERCEAGERRVEDFPEGICPRGPHAANSAAGGRTPVITVP